nr:integrase, catalytic region, zinc finger, CCHC-type, peptidase aspartic, catalytic [Tanacetum cinerariifolium]
MTFCQRLQEAKVKDYNYYKKKMLPAKKDSDEQVLLAEDQAWMESNLDTLSSVRIPKPSDVMWMKKGSSNTVKADLSYIVKICLWIIDSGCSKHMTGNRALLTNFVEKFLGTVLFGNNDFAVIAGYEDVVIGSMTIKKVYYVKGLGHNLFSVGQFCHKGLEIAFRKSTCFVPTEGGVDLLTDDRSSNLYTIALNEVASNSSACLLAKASSSQSWLWHQRLSHLNFATINNLVKNNLVQGKSSNPSVSQVLETSKKDLEDLFHNFYDEYFGSSKIMKSTTMNVETSNVEIPSQEEEDFHESSESFQEESSSSSLNDDVQQSPEEVILPQINTQSISNDMIPNVDEASTSHNVFIERLKNAYFDENTSLHDPFLSSVEPDNVAEALRDADWVSEIQDELDQFARLKTAFLNEILKEKVYVCQPPDFVSKQYPDHVYALDKALYGLKQAPRALDDVLD